MDKRFNLLENYIQLEENNIKLFYKGPFVDAILSEMSRDVKDKLSTDPLTAKRLFSIFMELAQNISFYSADKEDQPAPEEFNKPGTGTFAIEEFAESFRLIAGNLIRSEWAFQVVDRCSEINALNKDQLRKFKRDLRGMDVEKEHHVGANIGLVDVALKSGHPLEVEIIPVNKSFSYFVISVIVSK